MHIILITLLSGLLIAAAPEQKIGNFKLKDVKNKWQELDKLKGEKLTVIDFWATWCKPCVNAIPELVKISDKYKNKGVAFISINVDGNRGRQKIRPMAWSLGINFPVLLDTNGRVQKKLGISAVPSLLIIDAEGRLLVFHKGYRSGDEIVIEKEIKDYLGEKE